MPDTPPAIAAWRGFPSGEVFADLARDRAARSDAEVHVDVAAWELQGAYGVTVTSGVPDEEQGLATGLVTSTQQVGLTVGIPLLGVLATTSDDLLSGVHTVLALDTVVVLAAAALVAAGLRVRSGAVEAEPLGAR